MSLLVLERCAMMTYIHALGPSLVPMNACMCRGCPAPVWEDPAQKSLLDLIAPPPTYDLVQR